VHEGLDVKDYLVKANVGVSRGVNTPSCVHLPQGGLWFYVGNEQALVCLSNREIVDASRGRTFHCKIANNRFFQLVWPYLFSHLAAFNYNGKCPPYLRLVTV